jgi:hypothetical protein
VYPVIPPKNDPPEGGGWDDALDKGQGLALKLLRKRFEHDGIVEIPDFTVWPPSSFVIPWQDWLKDGLRDLGNELGLGNGSGNGEGVGDPPYSYPLPPFRTKLQKFIDRFHVEVDWNIPDLNGLVDPMHPKFYGEFPGLKLTW